MAIIDLAESKHYVGGVVGIDSLNLGGVSGLQPSYSTATPNAGLGVYSPLVGAFTQQPGASRFECDAAGIITYSGNSPRLTMFQAALSAEVLLSLAQDDIGLRMRRNGVGIAESEVRASSLANWVVNMRGIWQIADLQPGDTMQLEVANFTSGARDVATGYIVWTAI